MNKRIVSLSLSLFLLVQFYGSLCGFDSIVGKWDYASESNELLSGSDRVFILEGGPKNTFIEFKDGLYGLYRNDKLVYQIPYKIIKVIDNVIEIEIGQDKTKMLCKIYLESDTIRATVSKSLEYVYKKRD